MSLLTRAEQALSSHFEQAAGVGSPSRLVAAMRHAVFSGGALASVFPDFMSVTAWVRLCASLPVRNL